MWLTTKAEPIRRSNVLFFRDVSFSGFYNVLSI